MRHRKGELPAAEFAIGKAALILFQAASLANWQRYCGLT
jgi:hypothetical protein